MAGLKDYPVAGVLRAEDFERAKTFYADMLGITETEDMGPGGALFNAGGGSKFMIYERPGMPAPENTVLGFSVSSDAFDDLLAELRSKGVVFEDYDIPEMGIQTSGGVAEMDDGAKAAWFKDSEGNIINIMTSQK